MSIFLVNVVTGIYTLVGTGQIYKGQWEIGGMYLGYAIANIFLGFIIHKGLVH